MLKRNIGILIAGALLSAQVNLAAADEGTSPMSADEPGRGIGSTLPALTNYLEERAATIQKEGAVLRGDSFPVRESFSKPLPATAKYLEERAAELKGTRVRGDASPPSENDIVGKMLPAQARYFEQRTATRQARKLDGSVAGDE